MIKLATKGGAKVGAKVINLGANTGGKAIKERLEKIRQRCKGYGRSTGGCSVCGEIGQRGRCSAGSRKALSIDLTAALLLLLLLLVLLLECKVWRRTRQRCLCSGTL